MLLLEQPEVERQTSSGCMLPLRNRIALLLWQHLLLGQYPAYKAWLLRCMDTSLFLPTLLCSAVNDKYKLNTRENVDGQRMCVSKVLHSSLPAILKVWTWIALVHRPVHRVTSNCCFSFCLHEFYHHLQFREHFWCSFHSLLFWTSCLCQQCLHLSRKHHAMKRCTRFVKEMSVHTWEELIRCWTNCWLTVIATNMWITETINGRDEMIEYR